MVALEIDDRLLPILAETLADYPNTTVVNEDVLKTNLTELVATHFDGNHTLKVVANLPYYITTPILLHLLRAHLPLHSMTVMMQKEVAARLSATPGSKDYGSLSIAVQLVADVATAFTVSRHAFVPAPNVDSAIVTLTQRPEPLAAVKIQTVLTGLSVGRLRLGVKRFGIIWWLCLVNRIRPLFVRRSRWRRLHRRRGQNSWRLRILHGWMRRCG